MHDLILPLTTAVFFLGLILTVRFALPRWKDTKDLAAKVDSLQTTVTRLEALEPRVMAVETNVQTLHGNLVTVRDQIQFKAIAGSLRGGVTK